MSSPGFFDSLETQLGNGFDQTRDRRVRRRRLAGRTGGVALGLIALTGGVLLVGGDETAEAGVSVEERDGLVYVRLTDVEYRPDVIEGAAAAAGIDVSVDAVPASPSLVGRFVRSSQAGEDVGQLRELDSNGPGFSGFTIPAGFDGTLVLHVGRPAKGEEPYAQFGNAVSPGEPLACSGILGASPREAIDIVSSRRLEATWAQIMRQGLRALDTTELDDRAIASMEVARVLSTAEGRVQVHLSDGSTPLPDLELTSDAIC